MLSSLNLFGDLSFIEVRNLFSGRSAPAALTTHAPSKTAVPKTSSIRSSLL